MKYIKYTYETPLIASVYCEELLQDEPDYRICLEEVPTAQLIENDDEVAEFLKENVEDLTEHIPTELSHLVVKAVFGNFEICVNGAPEESTAVLHTEIYVRREPSQEEGTLIEQWVMGQLSDGWGESLEQKECKEDRIRYTKLEFDYTTLNFEKVDEYADVYWYLHPWNNDGKWYLELYSKEEVELFIEADRPVVYATTCNLQDDGHYIVRTVYQFSEIRTAVQCIRNSGCLYSEEFVKWMEKDQPQTTHLQFYVVCVNEGMFTQFLPILGVAHLENKVYELYTMDAEDGSVNMEIFKEDRQKEFCVELLNR